MMDPKIIPLAPFLVNRDEALAAHLRNVRRWRRLREEQDLIAEWAEPKRPLRLETIRAIAEAGAARGLPWSRGDAA